MSADELEQLLQFLYLSPVGMVDFDDEGAIRLINPQAVNLLAPTVGAGDASNVFAILAKAWPELARLVRRPGRPAQRLVEGHRVSGGPPEAPWRLSLDLVRVAPGRNMLALTDLTEAARREAEARALAGQLGESTERLEESRLAMARQRALLAAVVGAAPVGIALHDSRLRCLQLNEAMADLMGIAPGDAVGRTPVELLPGLWPSLQPLFTQASKAAAAGEVEGETPARPGALRCWLASCYPAPLPEGGRGVAMVLAEITDRRQAERALAESQSLLRSLFSAIDEGFGVGELVLDHEQRPVDCRFVEVNPVFETMTGLRGGPGRTAAELVPGLEPEWVATFARAGLGGETLRVELGSQALGDRWFEVFAAPLEPRGRFAAVLKDHTDRRRWELQLLESEARFRMMANQLPLMVWQHGPDGAQEWVNDTFCAFFGVTREEMRGDRWQMLVHPDDDAERYTAEFAAAVAERRPFRGEVRVRRADGEWRWMDSWAQPCFVDGAFVGFLGTSADVTERKAAEAALAGRHARAELAAELLAELEAQSSVAAQLGLLVSALAPALGDYATVEAPGQPEHLLALAHADPAQLEALRALRLARRPALGEERTIAGRAARGEALLASSAEVALEHAGHPRAAELSARLGPREVIAAPLDLGGGVQGALLVGRCDPARPAYTTDDVSFVAELAQRVGVVLAAAALRRAEHDIALRLQQALLPDSIRWHADVAIEARYHAASAQLEVGGDWYDTFAWPDGRIGVIVGDVVGHNLDSAAAMGRLRAATAALAGRLEPSPAGLLNALDDFARGPDGVSFATAACVIVDPASGLLTYSSAGHPPPLVVSPDRECVTLDAASSPPLCTQLRGARGDASVRLAPGSLVVVYTDGLVERRGERFNVGLDRLRAAAVELYDRPLAEIADELTAAMTASRPPQDDMAVACLRFAPAAARLALRVPARPGELAGVRRELRRWLTERQITGRHQRLVLLAAGEACTNAIEHGYRGRRDGHIELELSDHRHHLTLQVGDRGAWRPPSSLPPHHRGRGTTIMRSVASHFERASKAEGTAVTLALPAPLRAGLDR